MTGGLIFMLYLGLVLGGLVLFGMLVNVLLFPGMWQQPDVPAWLRWLAERGGREG
jgi:hypothetical protein